MTRPKHALVVALFAVASLDACADRPTAPVSAVADSTVALRWSDPHTWSDGVVPAAGQAVTIPAQRTILLDVSPPPLGALRVDGTLEFARRDVALSVDRIAVHGTLRIGSETAPFAQHATITLTGTIDSDATLGLTSKAVAIMSGGTLDVHGEPRVSWTRLDATAVAGATQLTLERDVDWRAGDHVVLAATDFDPAQYDEAVVRSVAGHVVTLEQPLKYPHWGVRQTIDGHVVDERAEVGLLTRNVVVRGDDGCATNGYCAHVVAFHGGTLRIEGVELYLVGQRSILARYPIHWHVAQDVPGQYARSNSVWHSFNRCVTVHGSHDATVEDNVCHDFVGHGFFLEDGIEQRNVIAGNLAVYARTPNAGQEILASDKTPAAFWITNPDNTVRGNVAAGSSGWGFWYALPEHPTGMSTTDAVWPRRTALREFSGNVAHSNRSGGLNVDNGPLPDGTTQTTSYQPRLIASATSDAVPAVFDRFVSWKHRSRGAWLRGRALRLANATLSDNGIGATFAADDALLQNAFIVGTTANSATLLAAGFPMRGFEFYDGTVGAQDVTFANFVATARNPASALGYNRANAFPVSPLNFAERVRLVSANAVYLETPNAAKDGDKAAVFVDRDGTVSGRAGAWVVASVPLLVDPTCVGHPEWNAFVCAGPFGRLQVASAAATEMVAPASLTRDDAVSLALAGSGTTTATINVSLPLARGYTLGPAAALTRPRLTLNGVHAGQWVRVSLPFAATSLTAWRDNDTSHRLTPAASLADLDASIGDRYFLANGTLHLKLVVPAGRDVAAVAVDAK